MRTDKKYNKKVGVLPVGLALTVIIGSMLAYNLFSGDKSFFLGGDTSHGHYQIELQCQACHTSPFATQDNMQQACESCHAKELDKVNDSHPKKVFLDPRNAELLKTLDARYCVSCHREHKPEITRDFGVTLASDFCFHCHQDIREERKSHKDFEFQTCASSGCHNFHDNTMLYEKFLMKNLDQPIHKAKAILPQRTGLKRWLKKHKLKQPLDIAEADIELFSEEAVAQSSSRLGSIEELWQHSIHARTDTNCSVCHQQKDVTGLHQFSGNAEENCQECHSKQHESFLESKHGMRLAQQLSPMSTNQARLDLTSENKLLSCSSCHNPHSLDVSMAAVDACLGCHQDNHSQNYKQSSHYQLWQQELEHQLPAGSGVSCATCHLPRLKKGKRVTVMHNQNFNLRPNNKMLRTVCMNCHGMEFSLASLSDRQLVESNFKGQPDIELETFQLIKERLKQKRSK